MAQSAKKTATLPGPPRRPWDLTPDELRAKKRSALALLPRLIEDPIDPDAEDLWSLLHEEIARA